MKIYRKPLFQWAAAAALLLLLTVGFCVFRRPAAEPAMADGQGIRLPVIMYHNVMPDGQGEPGGYVIRVSDLEGDLQYLQDCGFHTVTAKEIYDSVRGLSELPENPVLLTFDDGFETMSAVVYPLLEKYGCKAVVNIVGQYTDLYSGDVPKALSYSHLSWEQVKALDESGLVEIGSHTYDLHDLDERKGARRMGGESMEDYKKALSEDLLLLQERCRDHLRKEPLVFAYPYGFYDKDSEAVVKGLGFSMTLTCEEGVNTLTEDKACLFALKRNNRPYGADRKEFFKKLGIVPAE